ncbi:unnamed protein product [Symbiodinium microadriaticum]|nr:unnamed protein product [Symbiodinium microadriaticum]
MFEFLPGCFQHAQRNPIIGLTMMLEVLVDLLSNLVPALPGLEIPYDQKVVRVDLSDMAEFAAAVKNRFVFQTCVARSRFRVLGNRVRVEMTAGNWSRVLDVDSDMTTLAYGVKDIFMRQQAIESLVRHQATNTWSFGAKDHGRRERR